MSGFMKYFEKVKAFTRSYIDVRHIVNASAAKILSAAIIALVTFLLYKQIPNKGSLPTDQTKHTETSQQHDASSSQPPQITEIDKAVADSLLEKGIEYASKKNYELAIFYYDKAIVLNPLLERAFLRKGNAHKHLGDRGSKNDYIEGIESISRAIDINDQNSNSFCARGILNKKSNNTEAAISDLKRAVELDNENIQALINLCNIYKNKGEEWYDQALLVCTQCTTSKDYAESAFSEIAFIYFKKGNSDLAKSNFQEVLKINPDNARAIKYLNQINNQIAKS